MALWECQKIQTLLNPRGHWIFDGNKLAWSIRPNCTINEVVDLDAEKGRQSRGSSNSYRVQVRQVSQINLFALEAYLNGQTSFGPPVLESISKLACLVHHLRKMLITYIDFIDHLMRFTPSKTLVAIKRSFFHRALGNDFAKLGNSVLATKGVYQSLRMAQGATGGKLVVNADVANTCFWMEVTIAEAIVMLAAPVKDVEICAKIAQPMRNGQPIGETATYMQLKRLSKVRFRVDYRGMSDRIASKVFQVKRITHLCARDIKFTEKDRTSGRETDTNVAKYFNDRYGIDHLKLWYLPCVETMKGAIYPAELCHILPAQRYPFKLNEDQTSHMIKYAVTRPTERAAAIKRGLDALNWSNDPMLANYGMVINPQMIKSNARLLPAPLVEFGQGRTENPRTEGRWRIDGKRFIQKNARPLKSWAVVVFNDWGRDRASPEQVHKFMGDFGKSRALISYARLLTRLCSPPIPDLWG